MKKSIIFFIVILLAAKLFYWLAVFPNADEAYYWLWGRRPALSYHDHPALQALVQGVFYKLFGRSLFVLRLPAFLCSGVMVLIFYKLMKKLKFDVPYLSVLLIIFITPIYFVFTSFVWNDYLMITLSLSSVWFWLNYLYDIWKGEKGRTKDILLAFVFIGLAGISKYNSVFIALGVLSFILANKRLYQVFKDYRIYLGVIISLIIISPIFIWNIQNSMGSYEFNIQQRVLQPFTEKFFRGNIWGFTGGTLAMLSPFIIYAVIRIWKKPGDMKENGFNVVYRKLAKHILLVSTISFLFLSLFANVLYYWNIAAYLLIIPLAAEYLIRKKLATASLIYAGIINLIIVFHYGILPLNVLSEKAEDRDGVHHYGWQKIEAAVNEVLNGSGEDFQILTSSYRTSALLAFKTDKIDIYAYSPRFDQFDHWTKDLKFKKSKALILTGDWKPLNPELKQVCEDIQIKDTVKIEKWGYKIKDYYIYTGKIKDEYLESTE